MVAVQSELNSGHGDNVPRVLLLRLALSVEEIGCNVGTRPSSSEISALWEDIVA